MKAAKLSAAPPMNGNLDAWPREAADIRAEGGEYLAGHIFFPNSWTGPKALSARIRLGHDGKSLYLGVEVRDNVLEKGDTFRFSVSKTGYADWRTQSVKADYNWWVDFRSQAADQRRRAGRVHLRLPPDARRLRSRRQRPARSPWA